MTACHCLRPAATALALALGAATPALSQPAPAVQAVDAALEALGPGSGPLWASGEIAGEAWMLEQSGSLDGGWIRLDQSAAFTLSLDGRAGEVSQTRSVPAWEDTPYGAWQIRFDGDGAAAAFWPDPSVEAGGRWTAAPSSVARSAAQHLDLFPAALLWQARAAGDLRAPDAHHLAFTRTVNGVAEAVVVELDAGSGLPVAFEITSRFPDHMAFAAWGEVRVAGEYGFWWRTPDGRVQPRQLALTVDGRPWQRFELTRFAFSADAPDTDLAVPAAGADGPRGRAMADFPLAQRQEDIAAGVRGYFGAWNVLAVQQADGIVLLDAPISAGYVDRLIDQVEADFPGQHVIAAVSTSNAWPHAAGVAALADRGIPVYVHPANRVLVEGLIAAAGTRGEIRTATDGMEIGSGAGRIVIRHAPGPELSHMMFAVLPGRDLVWASDAAQLAEDGTPLPHARQYVAELLQAGCADLAADTRVLAMHTDPLPAATLRAAYDGEPNAPCPR